MRHTRLVRERDDAASLRDVLDELLNLTNEGLRTVTTAGQLAVTHAWFVRSVDMIRAALLLHDQGLGSAAHPLVRSAMEHGVGMLWLREAGDEGVGGLSNAHRQWARNVQSRSRTSLARGTSPSASGSRSSSTCTLRGSAKRHRAMRPR